MSRTGRSLLHLLIFIALSLSFQSIRVSLRRPQVDPDGVETAAVKSNQGFSFHDSVASGTGGAIQQAPTDLSAGATSPRKTYSQPASINPASLAVQTFQINVTSTVSPSPKALAISQKARLDPIIDHAPSTQRPVRVRVLLFEHAKQKIVYRQGPYWAIGDELLNICMDGFRRSPYFELVHATNVPDYHVNDNFVLKETEDIAWVVDMRRMVYYHDYTIARQLLHLAQSTIQWQREHNVSSTSLTVVLMDWRDRIRERTLCNKGIQQLIQLLGVGHVRSVVQQVVRGRAWDETRKFVSPGRLWNFKRDEACFGRSTLHVPYTVRSDYVEALEEYYDPSLSNSTHLNTSLTLPMDKVRTVDVAHFWTSHPEKHSNLRNAVSDLLTNMNGTEIQTSSSSSYIIYTLAQFVSPRDDVGRAKVSRVYLEALRRTKIVIVAQRDSWEDHYRLFEAILGGALVLSDPMLVLPDGLMDGVHLRVYTSLEHLQALLVYYLDPAHATERQQMARNAYELALSHHRSYHWMEELFFGQRLTV